MSCNRQCAGYRLKNRGQITNFKNVFPSIKKLDCYDSRREKEEEREVLIKLKKEQTNTRCAYKVLRNIIRQDATRNDFVIIYFVSLSHNCLY